MNRPLNAGRTAPNGRQTRSGPQSVQKLTRIEIIQAKSSKDDESRTMRVESPIHRRIFCGFIIQL